MKSTLILILSLYMLLPSIGASAQSSFISSAYDGQCLFLDDFKPTYHNTGNAVILRVYYNTASIVDTTNLTSVKEATVLEIGTQATKYFSYNLFKLDSLCSIHNDSPIRLAVAHVISKNYYPQTFYETFLLDYSTGTLTFTGRLGNTDFTYSEEIPEIEWTVEDSTRTIGNHLVQKATCSFRGRDYTAWFAPDIPSPYGPWKFHGLPGLILSVYDNDRQYEISVQRMTSDCPDQFIRTPEYDFIKTTRKDYLEGREKMIYNYRLFFDIFSKNDIRMGVPDGYVRKNPGNDFMERDYKKN